ncbi:MAG TPA: transcription antitermination factor NusB, partial [Candidatus Limnocylindrales bacterium]|nr:transcription antitermination factor NusB [Candidatus Limnocylindrales bacterium]
MRAGRRVALAAVFEAEFGQRTATAVLERQLAETEADPGARDLARAIVSQVVARRDTIDALIERTAPQFPVVQMARMDRALLRCALSEVLDS